MTLQTIRIGALPYKVSKTTELPSVSELQALENQCQNSFFLSSQWMQAWLRQSDEKRIVLWIYTQDDVLVGMCIFGCSVRHRFGIPVRQLRMYQTGVPDQDIICSEYNDVLAVSGREQDVRAVVLEYLRHHVDVAFDEIVLPGVTQEVQNLWHEAVDYKMWSHVISDTESAFVDLTPFHNSQETRNAYLSTLGKNTRSSIRRSIKLYEEMGVLRLHIAQDASEAWNMLQEAQPLHKQRWGKAAMEYDGYHTFHKELIHSSFATGCLDVLRVDCGDTPIGWLYNFIYNNRVYYYFGAFDFDSENAKLKPGLVTHTLAIEHYAKKGLGVYDFMAGNLRYKFNLGQMGSPIRTVALQNPTTIIKAEHAARAVKRLLRI